MNRPQPIPPLPGQESVWEYPRPPRLEPTSKPIQIIFNGVTIADTRRAYRVLETSHPPTYYLPPTDLRAEFLRPSVRKTFCEWKGPGRYYHLQVGDKELLDVAWYYPNPTTNFGPIQNYVAFYPEPLDRCTVDGQIVQPQAGGFYGGWITPDIVGPFKGEPGSWGW
ncbi:MAG: DUF427 domain-containing protein [Cyanobacteria bacterium P01_H01_bin.15]